MNLKNLAHSRVKQAALRLETAERAIRKEEFAYGIRQCQECVELALKGTLNYIGVEYPLYHEVSPILQKETLKFPLWFHKNINEFVKTSKELARKREPAMYGEETMGLPPEKLFTKEEASELLGKTKRLFKAARRLVKK